MFRKKTALPSPSGRRRPAVAERPAVPGAAVFSYHANRSARPGPQMRGEQTTSGAAADLAKSRKRTRLLHRGPRFLLAVIVGLLLLANVSISNHPRLVLGNADEQTVFVRDQRAYLQAAQAALASSVANTNKLTIDTERVAAQLRQQFPELDVVSVTLPLVGRQPTVYMQPRTPALILAASGGSFVVDTSGHALIAANQVPNLSQFNLPIINDQSGLSIQPGRVVLPSDSAAFITEVVGQMKAKHIDIVSLTLPAGGSELDVRPKGVGYFVKYNVRGDARAEAGTYLAVKAQLERDHKVPGAYIDVRVDNRAYYK